MSVFDWIPGKKYLLAAAAAFFLNSATANAEEEKKEVATANSKKVVANIDSYINFEEYEKEVQELQKKELKKKKLKQGTKSKAQTYFNDYGGLELKTDVNYNKYVVGGNIDVGSSHEGPFRIKGANLKLAYATDKSFIALQGGLTSPNEQLMHTGFAKLGIGTNPKNRDFNVLFNFLFMNSPELHMYRYFYPDNSVGELKKEPVNILGLNLRMPYSKKEKISEKLDFITNLDVLISAFMNIAPEGMLKQRLEDSDINLLGGSGSVLAMSHLYTKLEGIFQNDKGLGIGLYNDVDLAAAIIHNHGIIFRVRTQNIKGDLIIGGRGVHTVYIDDSAHNYDVSILKRKIDLFARANLSWMFNENIYLKSYADFTMTSKNFFTVAHTLGFKAGKFNIEAGVSYDNMHGDVLAIVGLSYNFDTSKKLIDPKKQRFYDEEVVMPKPDIYKWQTDETDVEKLHDAYGPNFQSALLKIKTLEDAVDLMSYFNSKVYIKEQSWDVSPEQIYMQGEGHCEPLNGVLWPAMLEKLGYKNIERVGIMGPANSHDLATAEDKNGDILIPDYTKLFFSNAKTKERAIIETYPSTLMIDGRKTPTGENILKLSESPIIYEEEDYFK